MASDLRKTSSERRSRHRHVNTASSPVAGRFDDIALMRFDRARQGRFGARQVSRIATASSSQRCVEPAICVKRTRWSQKAAVARPNVTVRSTLGARDAAPPVCPRTRIPISHMRGVPALLH